MIPHSRTAGEPRLVPLPVANGMALLLPVEVRFPPAVMLEGSVGVSARDGRVLLAVSEVVPPEVRMAVQALSPANARQIADLLTTCADLAERLR